jgi:H+/Cl- antiporter ClcA
MILGFAKLCAISATVAGGYRGGFIFPLFAAGAAFGRAFTVIVPSVSPTIATLCFAAAINVAITRTTLATTLILTALSGEVNAGPPLLAASLVSLFATSYMPFIKTQQSREDIREALLYSYTDTILVEEGLAPCTAAVVAAAAAEAKESPAAIFGEARTIATGAVV